MILVTGGTGLLGSHLLYSLLRDGQQVKATKREGSDLSEVRQVFSAYSADYQAMFDKIDWVNADMLVPEEVDAAVEGTDYVYHAAASISFDPHFRSRLIRNNREGTANIVDASLRHGVKKLCHVSSTSALGEATNGEAVNESMIWTPSKQNTGYSISKFHSEMEVWRGIEEGLRAVIVNPGIIFGTGFWNKGSSSMFSNIQKGLKFYLNGVTGFVGVEDVVKCMKLLMESDVESERFILVSENLSYREIFTMIAHALKVKPPSIEPGKYLSGLAWRMDAFRSNFGYPRVITRETILAGRKEARFSNRKIKEQFDFEFQPIEEVVRNMADSFLRMQMGKRERVQKNQG